jgi:hypothetical protein
MGTSKYSSDFIYKIKIREYFYSTKVLSV